MINKKDTRQLKIELILCLLICAAQIPALAEKQVLTEETVEYKTTTYAQKHPAITDSDIKRQLDHLIDSHKELDDDIAFESRDNVVTIRGVVDNDSERELAERLVREIEGIKKIENVIRVEDGWIF